MMNSAGTLVMSLVAIGLLTGAPSQEPGPLQKSLDDLAAKPPWIYDDLPAGYAQAKKTGKPLLVVFR